MASAALPGLEWYGDLLRMLAEYKIGRPDAVMDESQQAALARAMPLLREIIE